MGQIINHIHQTLALLEFEKSITSKLNLLIFMSNSHYQAITNVYDMVQKGIISHNILTTSDSTAIEKEISKPLTHNFNAMKIVMYKGNHDYFLLINIPIKSKLSIANIYRVIKYPRFHKGIRYSPMSPSEYVILTSLKATALASEKTCNSKTKVCSLSTPLSFATNNRSCQENQLLDESTLCPLTISKHQQHFFYQDTKIVHYSVGDTVQLKIICASGKNIESNTIRIQDRGELKIPKGCLLKNDDIIIFPKAYKDIYVNHSDVLIEVEIQQENLTDITFIPHKIGSNGHFSLKPIQEYKNLFSKIPTLWKITGLLGTIILAYLLFTSFKKIQLHPPPT